MATSKKWSSFQFLSIFRHRKKALRFCASFTSSSVASTCCIRAASNADTLQNAKEHRICIEKQALDGFFRHFRMLYTTSIRTHGLGAFSHCLLRLAELGCYETWFLKLVLLELIVQSIWGPLKLIFQHDTEIFELPAKYLDSLVNVASTSGTIRELLSGDDTILGKKRRSIHTLRTIFSANTTLENKREHTHTL